MGGVDKAMLIVAGQPLIAQAIQCLRPQTDACVISANGDPTRFAPWGLAVLPDDAPRGPLSGLLAGLDHAIASGAAGVVTVAVDTPVFPDDLVARLIAGGAGRAAIATHAGRPHPTFGYWPTDLRDMLASALDHGRHRVMDFAAEVGAVRVDFASPDPRAFANINTPSDLARAAGLTDV